MIMVFDEDKLSGYDKDQLDKSENEIENFIETFFIILIVPQLLIPLLVLLF